MKVLVPIKRVIDAYTKIRVKPDQTGVETSHVKMSMNPFDEIAVEEAIRMKEKNNAAEVIAISVGSSSCQETLRHALALGVDRAILIQSNATLEPLHIAKVLKKIVQQESIDMVLMGKQSIDGDNNQTGQMLAGLLGWPQGTFASTIEFIDGQVQVTREIDGGLETLLLTLPAVLTTDLRLNEPRYASLPGIMKAKQKPMTITPLEELDIDVNPHVEILKVEKPAQRREGIKVADVKELMDKLKNEAKVI